MFEQFSRTKAVIEDGFRRRLHHGVQIYVSLESNTLLDAAMSSESRQPTLDQNSIMLWRSAGKPLTAALALLFANRQQLNLDQPLSTWIEESRHSVVGEITLRDLLAHRSGLPVIDTGWPQAEWSEIICRIVSISELTTTAAYQPQLSWFLIAEVLQRIDGRPFGRLVRDELLQPLQMDRSWCGLPDEIVRQQSDQIAGLFDRQKGQLVDHALNDSQARRSPSPGGSFRGAVSDLARFYEWLGEQSKPGATELPAAEIRGLMTEPTRVGQFDETLQHTIDFGLGVILNSNRYGQETVPYGFGKYSSDAAFGHGGAQCAMGFCDPTFGLVVAWAADGLCGEGWHQRRNKAINEAIYEDLGLC